MYSTINAFAQGIHGPGKTPAGSSSRVDADSAFSRLYGSGLRGERSGIRDIVSRLQDRFPNARVREGEVGSGIAESKRAADADKDKTSDLVTVGSSLLQGMLGDAGLAGLVESVVGRFLEGMGGGATAAGGAYTQRSVTLTITTVRYTEIHRSRESAEILAASELQTGLRDNFAELLRWFFGADSEGGGEGEGASSSAEKASLTPLFDWDGRSASSFLWSMELFYSSSAVQRGGTSGDGGFQFSAGCGRFSFLASSQIPSLLSRDASGGGGGLSGLIDELLAGLGLSGGCRRTDDGFLLKMTQSRNLLAELMELYGDRIGGKAGTAPEESADKADVADATATATAAIEEMAESV